MNNKWYEVLGAGLLSVTAMYLSLALVVTGCSSDDSSVTGGDTEEYSEVVESSSDEEIEVSSSSEETVKPEKPEQAKSSSSEKKTESVESSSSEEEKSEPVETSSSSEETLNSEEAESSSSEENIESEESSSSETVEVSHAKEWEIIRDSITAVVENNSIQDLHESRFLKVERSDKSSRLDEYRMPEDEFVAEYQYDGYDQHLTDRLYEDGILWEGFNWTNLNKPECRFKAELDSILVHWSWPVSFAEIEATYNVRYFCQSLGLEGNVSIWIPVRYRAKED